MCQCVFYFCSADARQYHAWGLVVHRQGWCIRTPHTRIIWIPIWITGLIVLLFYKTESKYRVIGFIYILTVLTILVLRGKSYYTLGLYPILFAFGGYAVDRYFKTVFKYITIVIILLISIPMLPLSLPVMSHKEIEEYTNKIALALNSFIL